MFEVCLDLEGTLAGVLEATVDYLGKPASWKEVDNWEFEGVDFIGMDEFLESSQELWKKDWKRIPLVEEDLTEKLKKISQLGGVELDIVTARPDCGEEMKAWLEHHGIDYRDFKIEGDKLGLEYDVYIEDCPGTARKALKEDGIEKFFLCDMPYNREVPENGKVVRCRNFDEIYEGIQDLL